MIESFLKLKETTIAPSPLIPMPLASERLPPVRLVIMARMVERQIKLVALMSQSFQKSSLRLCI